MMSTVKKIVEFFFSPLYAVIYAIIKIHPERETIVYEFECWKEALYLENEIPLFLFLKLMCFKDYRSALYIRLGRLGKILHFLLPGRENFYFFMPSYKVGRGLILHHPISTRINCRRIGENFSVWQLVTIGKSKTEQSMDSTPIIGNNVKVAAGAIVIGPITIGNNVTIGAGAVVTKNVPDNCVVIGNPAYIIKRNGEKVNIKL